MGRRGPAPRPSVLNELAGNPGHRPRNEQEAQPEAGERVPSAPRWLSPEGRRLWKLVAPRLHKYKLLTGVDVLGLALLCDAYATYQEAREAVQEKGMLATSDKGAVYQHPAVGIMNSARKELLTWLREFGMTPSARTRIRIDQGDAAAVDDLFDEFDQAARRGRVQRRGGE